MKNRKSLPGFTLLEILLVVAAIAILAGIVILAINPNKQLADTRNAQREIDVNTILNAVYQYSVDNNGQLPYNIRAVSGDCEDTTLAQACQTDASSCSLFTDFSETLTTSSLYLVALPVDPSLDIDGNGTGYNVVTTTDNRVTVCAPNAEQDKTISASR